MADQLEAIVQRMIDAGESEDNIASVIKEYKPPYEGGALSRNILSGDHGGYPEGYDPSQSLTSKIGHAIEPLAHPQTTGDMLSLLLPAGVGGAVGAIKGYMSAGARAIKGAPNMRSIPGRMLSTLYKDATAAPPIKGFARYAPNISAGPQTVYAEGAEASAPIVERYMANSGGAAVPKTSIAGHVVGHMPESVPTPGPPIQSARVPYGVPDAAAAAPLDAIAQLRKAGLQQWQIDALSRNPKALAEALASLNK